MTQMLSHLQELTSDDPRRPWREEYCDKHNHRAIIKKSTLTRRTSMMYLGIIHNIRVGSLSTKLMWSSSAQIDFFSTEPLVGLRTVLKSHTSRFCGSSLLRRPTHDTHDTHRHGGQFGVCKPSQALPSPSMSLYKSHLLKLHINPIIDKI